jgi:hypothetical protein
VADGVKNQAYMYNLAHSYAGERLTLDDEAVGEYEQTIVSELQKIRVFYNYQPSSEIASNAAQKSTIAQLYSLLFSK